jgi:hypothetical protein
MVAIPPGSVLTDQTLVCEAARLLDPGPASRLSADAERLAQLSLLLDAVLLYDRVYTVAADLPRDVDDLTLRRELTSQGVLAELDTSAKHDAIAKELGRFLAAASGRDPQRRPATAAYYEKIVRTALGEPSTSCEPPHLALDIAYYLRLGMESDARGDAEADRRAGIRHEASQPAEPIGGMGVRLAKLITSGRSGGVPVSIASGLRTFVYWRLSAHLDLPFYPSLRRLPDYLAITGQVRRTAQDAVYNAVAESFRTTVQQVYEDDAPLPTYLPPALTLFLSHLAEGHDLSTSIARLRTEFKPLRQALAQLQQDRERASSLSDMHAARARFAEVANQLRGHGPGPAAVLDQALDIAPNVAVALANPLDVTSYPAALLKAPAHLIRTWWRRRPYRPAFHLRDRLLAVRDYADLLRRATGIRIDQSQLDRVAATYDGQLQRLRLYSGARLPGGLEP